MTNLIEVAEELEFVPKESLIELAQDPNSRFPSYMVLSEIQRRTQMEKMYNAARMERPQTTVAQELVGEFSQPQGLAGAMTDDLGRLPNNFSDSVAPANSLMQMANGGQTGSDAIRQAETSLGREPTFSEIAASYNENQRLIREQEAEQRRIEAERIFGGLGKNESSGDTVLDFFSPEGQPTVDEVRRSNLEAVDRFFGGSETEDNYLEKAGKFVGVLDEEGNIDKVGTALALASINPLFRAGRYAYGAARGLPKLYQKLFPRFYKTKKGDYISTGSPQGQFTKNMSGTRPDKFKKTFRGDMKRVDTVGEKLVKGLGVAGLGGAVLRQMSNEGQKLDTEELDKKGLDNRGGGTGGGGTGEGGKDKGDDGKKKDGLLGKIDPLDIAKLGGIILGAKGTGDIGQGITALASDVQQRRTAQQERLADEAYRQLQGDYLKSQKQMLDINIANAPTTLLLSKYEALNKAYKQITEQAGNSAEAQEIAIAIKLLSDELTGRAANTNTGQESLEGLGATLTQGG